MILIEQSITLCFGAHRVHHLNTATHIRPVQTARPSFVFGSRFGDSLTMLVDCASSCLTYAPLLFRVSSVLPSSNPSLTFRNAAVFPRNLRAGALVFLRGRAMGSSSASVSLTKTLVKSQLVEIQTIRDDPARLEAMTVQELRTVMRSVGIATKGRKCDLVSALKCFLDDEKDGQSSLVTEEHASSMIKPIHPKRTPSKRKPTNSSSEDLDQQLNAVSKNSEIQQDKRRGKPSSIGSTSVKLNSKISTTKQNLSVKTDGVPGKKQSGAKRKSLQNFSENDRATNGADQSINPSEPWTMLAHKKPQQDWVPYNPRTMRPPPLTDETEVVKLMSWNVNGLRALLKLEGFSALELAQRENFDVLCLQETKLQEKDVEEIKQCLIDGYENSFWACSVSKLGYSGTAIISRIKPLSVRYGLGISDHDSEGRLVTMEFDTFYLLNAYVPNSGDGLKRLTYRVTQWDLSLGNYMKELEKSKPVILTGDLNCAHQEIDIFNPAGNRRSAGFTDEERKSFETNFLSRDFVDTFRKQHPGVVGYTYWGYRHNGRINNKGWRLDYFLVSESIADKVHDSYILPDVTGSDHCPIGLILKL